MTHDAKALDIAREAVRLAEAAEMPALVAGSPHEDDARIGVYAAGPSGSQRFMVAQAIPDGGYREGLTVSQAQDFAAFIVFASAHLATLARAYIAAHERWERHQARAQEMNAKVWGQRHDLTDGELVALAGRNIVKARDEEWTNVYVETCRILLATCAEVERLREKMARQAEGAAAVHSHAVESGVNLILERDALLPDLQATAEELERVRTLARALSAEELRRPGDGLCWTEADLDLDHARRLLADVEGRDVTDEEVLAFAGLGGDDDVLR